MERLVFEKASTFSVVALPFGKIKIEDLIQNLFSSQKNFLLHLLKTLTKFMSKYWLVAMKKPLSFIVFTAAVSSANLPPTTGRMIFPKALLICLLPYYSRSQAQER